jgi:hypothetical protein
VSGYRVYRYLYYMGLEGGRRIADQGCYFLPGAQVKTCSAGNGGLVLGKNVDVTPVQVVDARVFIYLFIYSLIARNRRVMAMIQKR